MADVPRLAVDAAVFHSNNEIIGKKRGKNLDIVLPVGFSPLHLQRADGFAVRFLLRGNGGRGDYEKSEGPRCGCAHNIYVAQTQSRNKFLRERPLRCEDRGASIPFAVRRPGSAWCQSNTLDQSGLS